MTKFVKSLKFGKNGEKYIIKDDNAHEEIEALKAKVDSLELPDVSNTFFYEVLNDD